MKKIIYLLLVLTVTCSTSCAREHYNEPYGPNYRDGQTERDNPTVDNSEGTHPLVCDDYYNRYNLADGVNVFLSDCGTLYWYDAALDLCPKICWADLSLRRDGYFIRVYRLIRGNMREVAVYDTREIIHVTYDVLICDIASPDYLYPRRVEIAHVCNNDVLVRLLSVRNYNIADEVYHM